MRSAWGLVAACVFVFLLPSAEAQRPVDRCSQECSPTNPDVNGPDISTKGPVKVILYSHWEDILNTAPLNTQPPAAQHERDMNRGFLMPAVAAEPAQIAFNNNHFDMVSTPALVEYLPDGWRIHNHPGLAADLRIAGEQVTLYWYMSAESVPGQPTTPASAVGAMPQVTVYARLETGRFVQKGLLIAESDERSPRGDMISTPGRPSVYEFRVPMRVLHHVIPADPSFQGFIVHVHPHQISLADGMEASQSDYRIRSGARFPPRLILPLHNPLESLEVDVKTYNGSVYVRAAALSPFGAYDVDPDSLRIRVEGPAGIRVHVGDPIIRRSIDCDGLFKPVVATWKIDGAGPWMEPGRYRIQVTADNRQGTYRLVETDEYRILSFEDGSSVGIPGLPASGAAFGILLGALLTRLRR